MWVKLLTISSLFAALSILMSANVFAADLTVTCNGVSCSNNGGSLFNETPIAPGYSITKTILINNSANIDDCRLHLFVQRQGPASEPDLAGVITTVISSGGTVYFGDQSGENPQTLAQIFGQDVYLGIVNGSSSKEYNWDATFQTSSGNDYQGKEAAFSFNLNFTCGSIPTPTPIHSQPQNNTNGGAVQGLSTTATPIPTTILPTPTNSITDNSGIVLGATCNNTNNWWIVIIIQMILSVVVLIIKWIKSSSSQLWIVLFALGILSQLAHNYWGCGCSINYWCSNYLIPNILITLASCVLYYFIPAGSQNELKVK